jgi:hypothetical protein
VSPDATPTSSEPDASLGCIASAIQDLPRGAKRNDKIGSVTFVEQAAFSGTIVEENDLGEEFRDVAPGLD